MFGRKLKKAMLATVAAGALAVGFTESANAFYMDWQFNLGAADGMNGFGTGMGKMTNIKQVSFIGGSSTIDQKIVGGSPFGQPFTDSGYLELGTFQSTLGAASDKTQAYLFNPTSGPHVALGGSGLEGMRMYFTFDNLNGTFTGGSPIALAFNTPQSGKVHLWLDADGDLNPNTDSGNGTTNGKALLLADFDVVDPSNGSGFGFVGGGGSDGNIGITLVESSGIAGLFLASDGVTELGPGAVLHFGNVNAFNPTFTDNCTGGAGSTCVPGGTGIRTFTVDNNGQYNLTSVAIPEPSTMAAMGLGLLGLGGLSMRRRKAS